jgi:sugar transferase (PEP-CTERM/EpsH1 system associated)
MSDVLFLAHRIPYPPNKGDKIRSWRLLSALSRRHRVHLGTFIDSRADWAHTHELSRICASSMFVPLSRPLALAKGALAMARARALSLGFYSSARLRRWVDDIVDSGRIARMVVFASSMTPYAEAALSRGVRVVADYCDVDSEKWGQYADRSRWPLATLYRREGQLLRAAERYYSERVATTTFISRAEAQLFCRTTGVSADRVSVVPNGIDTAYFDPDAALACPFPQDCKAVVFTGAMDYLPNMDAVEWFATQVLPRLRAEVPRIQFFIVGSNPAPRVQQLAGAGVTVTGTVPDIRPYLKFANVVVAPLQIARGVQNKVLEAMAMRCRIVATPHALTGLDDAARLAGVTSAEGVEPFANAVLAALAAPADPRLDALRAHVRSHYSWDVSMDRFLEHVDGPTGFPVAPAASAERVP